MEEKFKPMKYFHIEDERNLSFDNANNFQNNFLFVRRFILSEII
jgi:hypothetical protein